MQDYTPLMHACKNGHVELAKLLVSFGADTTAENEEVSAHAACCYVLNVHGSMSVHNVCRPARLVFMTMS